MVKRKKHREEAKEVKPSQEEKKGGADEEAKSSKRARTDNKHKPPLLVFAHGAGAPSTSEWMIRWKKLLASSMGAVDVVTFDYPYCAEGKKGAPPKAEKLVDPHVKEINKALLKYPDHPLVLVGKSMGSRVSCMVAGRGDCNVSAVVCLGYPLKGTGGAVRDETLFALKVPVMFVQGSKDGLCPLNKLQEVLEKMTCVTKLHVVEGGDHSFKVGKKALQQQGASQEKLDEEAACSIQSFLKGIVQTF